MGLEFEVLVSGQAGVFVNSPKNGFEMLLRYSYWPDWVMKVPLE